MNVFVEKKFRVPAFIREILITFAVAIVVSQTSNSSSFQLATRTSSYFLTEEGMDCPRFEIRAFARQSFALLTAVSAWDSVFF